MSLQIHNALKFSTVLLIFVSYFNAVHATENPPTWTKTCETLTSQSVQSNNVTIETKGSAINSSLLLYDCNIEEDFNIIDTTTFYGVQLGKYTIEVTDPSAVCIDRNEIILCNSTVEIGPDQVLCDSPITITALVTDPPECIQFDCTQEEHLIGFHDLNCKTNEGIQPSFESSFIDNATVFGVSNGINSCNYVSNLNRSFDFLRIDGVEEYAFTEFEMTAERIISSLSYYHFVARGFPLFGDCSLCFNFSYDIQLLVNNVVEYEETVQMGIGNVELKSIELTNSILVNDGDIVKLIIGKNRQSCLSNCQILEIAGINIFGCVDDFENTGGSFDWVGPSNFSSSEASVSVDLAGTYCINYTDCAGCVSQDCIYISAADETCVQATCGLQLGQDQILCDESITLTPVELNLECTGTSQPPTCECPPGFTRVTSSNYDMANGATNVCYIGTGNYTLQVLKDSNAAIYACGGVQIIISSSSNMNCVDLYALKGSSINYSSSGSFSNIFVYTNEASEIDFSTSGNITTLHSFNTGGDVILGAVGDVDNLYAVGSPCGNTTLSLNSNNIANYYATAVVASQNNIPNAIIADPLSPIFDNFGGCSATILRQHYSSAADICGDNLDNDFNCELDDDCNTNLEFNWSTGESTEMITVNSPGEYCLTVTCDDTQCTDCVFIKPIEADAGPDILSCSPGECFYIGATLVGPPGATYSWSTGHSGLISDIDNGQIEVCPSLSTNYSVTVTKGLSCSRTDDLLVTVDNPIVGNISMITDSFSVCTNEVITISANIETESQIPLTYEEIFLLSKGPDGIILQQYVLPEFSIMEPGAYSIHTLVYSPSTLDLSTIDMGNFSKNELLCQLYQGGGDICANFDTMGVSFQLDTIPDSDNDGVCDAIDICLGGDDRVDTDADGIPDFCDSDCETLRVDNFETDQGIWYSGGIDAERIQSQNSPYGEFSFRIRDNSFSASAMYTSILDLNHVDLLTISFAYQAKNVDLGEDFLFEISQDGGKSFIIFEQWVLGEDFTNNVIYNEQLEIAWPYLSDNTVLRFRCDASINADEIYIDNILIDFCPSECPRTIIDNQGTTLDESQSAGQTIETNGAVLAPNDLEFRSGNSILLNSGFEVKLSASFHAIIESCDPQ